MLYFIPAWYQQNEWSENEQSWMERRMHTEFDDTVKQIQLFHRSGAYPYQIILLSYAPNFRHFLHRQSIYRAPYWSCFDAIQEVRRKKAAVLSFHRLKWPEGIEFVYTPFVVIAMLQNQKYAQIDFGEDGNPIRIDLYKAGIVCRRNLYDDRGFISSTILFQDGQPIYQDYLMENGKWKMRHYKQGGYVEINVDHPGYLLEYQGKTYRRQFLRRTYENMEQVIGEVLCSYLELVNKNDIFCVAMHQRHTALLAQALKKKKLILSFYSARFVNLAALEVLNLVREGSYIVADSKKNLKEINDRFGKIVKGSAAIPPYDSRVDSGISQQFAVQKLLVAVDGMEDEKLGILIRLLGEYLPDNENACICLFTRRTEYDRKQRLLEWVRRELREAGMEEGWAAEDDGKIAENQLDLEEPIPIRFFVEQCVDELAVSKCMREQRLLIDLRNVPELYLQITAISIGIPQIVCTQTEFVEHGGNGMVLPDISKLPAALHYYLDRLQNWNRASVYSYEMVKEYTTERLLEKWSEVIRTVGGNSGFTNRK